MIWILDDEPSGLGVPTCLRGRWMALAVARISAVVCTRIQASEASEIDSRAAEGGWQTYSVDGNGNGMNS